MIDLDRFEGIVSAKQNPDGLIAIMWMTDFSNPRCRREVFDVVSRKFIRRREVMLFVCTEFEADKLHTRR
jgi:hypothetical protein